MLNQTIEATLQSASEILELRANAGELTHQVNSLAAERAQLIAEMKAAQATYEAARRRIVELESEKAHLIASMKDLWVLWQRARGTDQAPWQQEESGRASRDATQTREMEIL